MLPDSSSVLNANFSYKQAIASTSTPVQVLQSGQFWASVKWSFDLALVATLQPQYSVDGGLNWLNAPYSTRRDAVSANPTTSATVSPAAAAQTWETPLPGNANAFRLNPTAFTTPGSVTIFQGAPYVPGIPVVGVLYDATVTAGGANNTGALDTSGWNTAEWEIVVATAASGLCTINAVDDAGTSIAIASVASLATGTFAGALGVGVSMGTGITPITGLTQIPLPRRTAFALAGATTSSIRLRATARR